MRNTRSANQYRADPDSLNSLSPEAYVDAVIDMLEVSAAAFQDSASGQRGAAECPGFTGLGHAPAQVSGAFEARLLARETWQGRLFTELPPHRMRSLLGDARMYGIPDARCEIGHVCFSDIALSYVACWS